MPKSKLSLPPGATLVDDGTGGGSMQLPPGATLVPEARAESAQPTPVQAEKPGLLSRAWDFVNKGLVSGDRLEKMATGGRDTTESLRTEANALPSDWDVKHPILGGMRKGALGLSADTMDTLSSFTSPLSIGLLATGPASKGAGALGKAARVGQTAAGALFAGKGAVDMASAAASDAPMPDRVQKGLQGAASFAGGLAGGMSRKQFANAPIKEAPSTLYRNAVEKGKSVVMPGTPEQLIVRATKPNVGLPDFEQSVSAAMPELAKRNPQTLNGLASAADEIKLDRNMEYQDLKRKAGNAPVPTYSVARAQMDSIPAMNLFEDPAAAGKVNTKASRYQTTMPIEDADALRLDSNAKLREFFNKSGGDKNAALSNPETARVAAVNNGVRNELYDTLQQATGVDPRPIQEMYGHAVDIGDTAGRRNTVFSRRQSNGMNEIVNTPKSIGDFFKHPLAGSAEFVTKKLIADTNDSNTQTKWAFDRYAHAQRPKYRPNVKAGALGNALANSRQR